MTMARRVHHNVPPVNFSEIGEKATSAIDDINKTIARKSEHHDLHFLYDGTDPHPTAISCLGCDWTAAVG